MIVKCILMTLALFTFLVGVVCIACMCAYLGEEAVCRFKKWRQNKCRIRWLCKHTYVEDFTWQSYGHTEVHLVCRKCGKEMQIDIYDDEDEEDEDEDA